jgi:hypothetical protein
MERQSREQVDMTHHIPDVFPVLSRGKHRSPRKGACFMELASYLAGEKWSDHPSCTHPLLAALARDVNDHVSDPSRTWLAPLVPDVIALNGDDPRVDAWIARDAALAALPVVSAERQGVAAVGLLRCEWFLARQEGRDDHDLAPGTRAALDAVPHARDWARRFGMLGHGSEDRFQKRSAPVIVHAAVSGIAAATVPDADRMLVDLLETTIGKCRTWFGHDEVPITVPEGWWDEVCALTTR